MGLSFVTVVLSVFSLVSKFAGMFGANSGSRPDSEDIWTIINWCQVAMLAGFVVALALNALRARMQKAAEFYGTANQEEAE